MEWAKTTARPGKEQIILGIWCTYIRGLTIPSDCQWLDRYEWDTFVLDLCLKDYDPRVFPMWGAGLCTVLWIYLNYSVVCMICRGELMIYWFHYRNRLKNFQKWCFVFFLSFRSLDLPSSWVLCTSCMYIYNVMIYDLLVRRFRHGADSKVSSEQSKVMWLLRLKSNKYVA